MLSSRDAAILLFTVSMYMGIWRYIVGVFVPESSACKSICSCQEAFKYSTAHAFQMYPFGSPWAKVVI
uniref:Putative secreted protein midgut overexpressed n=1 Tax=Rhipicephalus microplus TaxID=6941 RepID=A0A6M2DBZ7_RHIMP